jgi:hypothetical protein
MSRSGLAPGNIDSVPLEVVMRRFLGRRAGAALALVLTLAGGHPCVASAADAVGSLAVESDPSGASVYVDGVLVGHTPLALALLARGDHRIRLASVGYLDNSRIVTVNSGKTVTLRTWLTARAVQSAQATGLKIVVIEGEDAVNVIQQKTAVAPVVEVRDRNDQPVAGAVVRFAIQGGRASFNGARAITVTTNAVGRAAVSSVTPASSGAFQITASAAFQGQTAVATIVQTNVMTVAEGAAASGAAGGVSGGGGAAGGAGSGGAAGGAAGGGLSATTVGIVGGAIAGGAIATKEALGNSGDNSVTYSGRYAGQSTYQFLFPCTQTFAHSGNVHVTIQVASDGAVSGTGGVEGTMTLTAVTAGCTGQFAQLNQTQVSGCCTPEPPVRGTTGSLSFSGSHPGNAGSTFTYDFAGALSGTTIAGTFTLTIRDSNGVFVWPPR